MKWAIEIKDMVVRRDIHRLIADVKADEGVLRLRRMQLETLLLTDEPAIRSHDTGEMALTGVAPWATLQAAQNPPRPKLAAAVAYDLWRFSCEMPDAPHLRNLRR